MSKSHLESKEDARSHIVNAMKLVHYMNRVKYGDWPEQQEKYEKEITKAKKELRQVYSPDNVIFQEIDFDTHMGLLTSLGALGLGDEPFIDMKRGAPENFGAETFAGEMKNLVLDYVETIHPEDEGQQNQLMDLILSGEYEVPLDEMQIVVETPSLARPHMREMALASESFEAEEGRQYDLGILNVDRFWTQFVGKKRKSRRKKFKCEYNHPKRICPCEAQQELRNSPLFTKLTKQWSYYGAMILTNLPELDDDYSSGYHTNQGRHYEYRPTKVLHKGHRGDWNKVDVENVPLQQFHRTAFRAATQYQGAGKSFKQAYMPISLDWAYEIAENEQMGFFPVNAFSKKSRSEKELRSFWNAKGEVKEIRDDWLAKKNKINGSAEYIEVNGYRDYDITKADGPSSLWFTNRQDNDGQVGFAIKANKKEYLMAALARKLYLTMSRNRTSPKYRITSMEDKTMDYDGKTKDYLIAPYISKYNSDLPTQKTSIPTPIHVDFKTLDEVGAFLRERYEVLSYMIPKLKRVAKNGRTMSSLSIYYIDKVRDGDGFIDHPAWFPHNWSANQYGNSPISKELGIMARQVLGFNQVQANAESFSATTSNNHTSLARSQNHMGAESYVAKEPHDWRVNFVGLDGETVKITCEECGHSDYSSCHIHQLEDKGVNDPKKPIIIKGEDACMNGVKGDCEECEGTGKCLPEYHEGDDCDLCEGTAKCYCCEGSGLDLDFEGGDPIHRWEAYAMPWLADNKMQAVKIVCKDCGVGDVFQAYVPYECLQFPGTCPCEMCDGERIEQIEKIDYAIL